MNLKAYLKGCDRGKFQWECVESGTYGDGEAVDVETVCLNGRVGNIRRCSNDYFEAEIDNLEKEPFYEEKYFTSRRSARLWIERMIKKDIDKI